MKCTILHESTGRMRVRFSCGDMTLSEADLAEYWLRNTPGVRAVRVYDRYADAGLKEKIPFFGVGMQYIRFAREEPVLYRLLFLTQAKDPEYSAMNSMRHLQALVRPTLVNIYHITIEEANLYFRDLWFVVHSLSTLIVTGDCPYSDQEIGQILTRFSICIFKSMKEIPGFAEGTFDRDAVFRALIFK